MARSRGWLVERPARYRAALHRTMQDVCLEALQQCATKLDFQGVMVLPPRGPWRVATMDLIDNCQQQVQSSGAMYGASLCLGMSWSWREGSVSQIEREYDGYGYLREVRLGQAVKGGWSGGRI